MKKARTKSKRKTTARPPAKVHRRAASCSGVLVWRRGIPAIAGWWWWRADAEAEPQVQKVYPNMDGDLILTGGASFLWLASVFPKMEWAGPLIAPTSRPNAEVSDK